MAFQGVRRKPCSLLPFGGNFLPCLSKVNFSYILSFDFVAGILDSLTEVRSLCDCSDFVFLQEH